MTNNLKDDIRKTLLLGLANHTDEFLNPGFIPGMSHEELAKVLDRIMNSRLIERVEALINQKEKEAVVAFAEGCIAGPMQDGFYTMSKSEMQNRIKQLKEELKEKQL